jgi:hypothetical protein
LRIELYDREKSYLRRNREVKIEKKRDIMKKIGKNRTHTHAHRERERVCVCMCVCVGVFERERSV